ncbi:hypothetical protein [uncultured Bacteroides sp.]|uniref:hypothetical protein n=1 Tax=uncultured Bacteroides sp. TaxID=162156 RepID=UPI0025B67B15|nr:hypothetical protein [uncultured Bacteroides sp.]
MKEKEEHRDTADTTLSFKAARGSRRRLREGVERAKRKPKERTKRKPKRAERKPKRAKKSEGGVKEAKGDSIALHPQGYRL